MNDNYGFKVFREPLGSYAYIPDCQLQFIEMKIDYLNRRFFYHIAILAILNIINNILGYSSSNINIGICTFVYTNYIASIVNILCAIILGICVWQRISQSSQITNTLKHTFVYIELGYVNIYDINEDNEELYKNIENIYGISKEDFLKLYHK